MSIVTLKSIKSILSTMGLLSGVDRTHTRPELITYWPNLLYTIPLLTLLFPLMAYFQTNMVNLIKATDAYYVIAATLMCIGQYWFLVVQKPELSHLMFRLQYLVDQSINLQSKHHKRLKKYFFFSPTSPYRRKDESIIRSVSKCGNENHQFNQCHESIRNLFVFNLPIFAIRFCRFSLHDWHLST